MPQKRIGIVGKNEQGLNSQAATFGRTFAAGLLGAFSVQAARQFLDRATAIRNALKVAGLEGEQLAGVYQSSSLGATQRGADPNHWSGSTAGFLSQQQPSVSQNS